MLEKMTEMKAMMALLRPFMPWLPSGLYPNITFSNHLKKKIIISPVLPDPKL